MSGRSSRYRGYVGYIWEICRLQGMAEMQLRTDKKSRKVERKFSDFHFNRLFLHLKCLEML